MLECRLCLQIGPSVYVFEESKALPEKIWDCCGLTIMQNDELPKHICLSCEVQLNSFIEFKQTCIHNEIVLKDRHKEIDNDNEESKVSIDIYDRNDISPERVQDDNEEYKLKNVLPSRETENAWFEYISKDFTNDPISTEKRKKSEMCTEKKNKCDICGKFMSSLSSLKNHVWRIHENRKSAHCISKTVTKQKLLKRKKDEIIDVIPMINFLNVKNEENNIDCGLITTSDDKKVVNGFSINESERFLKQIKQSQSENENLIKKTVSCNICKKMYVSKKTLDVHVQSAHDDRPKSFECDICHKIFSKRYQITYHIKQHMNLMQKYQCDKCVYKAMSNYQLRIHIERKHANMNFQCGICGKTFGSKINLNNHVKRNHDAIQRAFECDICHKIFSKKYLITPHIKRHMNVLKKHKCDRCDYKAESNYHLRLHIEGKHLNMWNCQCTICGKTFRTARSCRLHAALHENRFPYQCDYCGKEFKRKSSILPHITIHMGIKRFKCAYCSRRFTARSTLKSHTYRHTGENPFSCELCHKGFKQRSSLKSHLKRYHKKLK